MKIEYLVLLKIPSKGKIRKEIGFELIVNLLHILMIVYVLSFKAPDLQRISLKFARHFGKGCSQSALQPCRLPSHEQSSCEESSVAFYLEEQGTSRGARPLGN